MEEVIVNENYITEIIAGVFVLLAIMLGWLIKLSITKIQKKGMHVDIHHVILSDVVIAKDAYKELLNDIQEKYEKVSTENKSLAKHMERLSDKIDELIKEIKEKEKNRQMWENDSMRKDGIIEQKNKLISKQYQEIEEMSKEIKKLKKK